MILHIVCCILGLAVVAAAVFLVICICTGAGKIEPFCDENGELVEGSVAEKVFIDVNGRKNGSSGITVGDFHPHAQ